MDSKLLAVIVPIAKPLPKDLPQPLLRVAGFPATTKLEESSYIRRTFDHLNLVVENNAIIPTPRVTLKEHHRRAFQEIRQGRVHPGEAWVKDSQDLNSRIMNVDTHYGYYGYYYEGADGPVPDLQESAALAAAGNFTKPYEAGLPLSFEIRQQIYREVVFADYQNPAALFNLASTGRLLRAEVISFHRANFAFAFRHPVMLSRFLQYNEPDSVLLKYKENMLTFSCVMIDLRSQLTSCPTKTMQIYPDIKVKTCKKACCEAKEGSPPNVSQHDLFDKINLDILHLSASLNNADSRDVKYIDSLLGFGFKQEPFPPNGEPNTRRGIDESTFLDWYAPMMKLLNGYKIQKLIIRRDFCCQDALTSSPELVECLLGFSKRYYTITTFENVGGWAWDALEYNINKEENKEEKEEKEKKKDKVESERHHRGFQKVWEPEEEDECPAELDETEKELVRRARARFFVCM